MGYSGNPASSPTDEVRFLIGDTDDPGLLSDEEIAYFVTKLADTYSGLMMVGAYCADVIATRFAGEVSISADGVTYSGEQLQTHYQAVAAQLRSSYEQLQSVGAEAFAGGTDVLVFDPSRIPLNFGVGMHDNARAGLQRYGYVGDVLLPYEDPELDPSNYQP